MGRKCCVFGCKTNYDSRNISKKDEKISVFRFPKDENEKHRWISAIPNANLRVTNDTVVCQLHWPADFETVRKKGSLRPKNPPSVWQNIPVSQIRKVPAPARPTKRTLSSQRCSNYPEVENLNSDSMTLNLKDCSTSKPSLAGASGLWGPVEGPGGETEPVCKVEAGVPAEEVMASKVETVPLFPAVYIKEELPDDPLESVCIKVEPLSDAPYEGDSSDSLSAPSGGGDTTSSLGLLEEQGQDTAAGGESCGTPLATCSSSLAGCSRYTVTDGGKFQCSECERIDDTEESIEFHVMMKHSCPELCRPSQGARTRPAQWSDVQRYANANPFQCSQCDFSTLAKSHFKKHVLAKHSGVRPFQCNLCEYSTAYKNHLNRHVLVKHSDAKPFQCLECEYSSAYKNHLKQHVLAKHSGVRPYQCTQCEYSSSYKNHLKQHTMIKHSGVKPFQCSECQFSTADKNHLKKHTAIKHSGTKRFHCSQCKHSSAYKGNLRIHFRAKHSGS